MKFNKRSEYCAVDTATRLSDFFLVSAELVVAAQPSTGANTDVAVCVIKSHYSFFVRSVKMRALSSAFVPLLSLQLCAK